jgi:hypothetical protein
MYTEAGNHAISRFGSDGMHATAVYVGHMHFHTWKRNRLEAIPQGIACVQEPRRIEQQTVDISIVGLINPVDGFALHNGIADIKGHAKAGRFLEHE